MSSQAFYSSPGVCPLDGGRADHLVFTNNDPGDELLPAWADHMIRVCPYCLTASTEKDFLTENAVPGPRSLNTRLKSPYGQLRKAFVRMLPARLDAAQRHCRDCTTADWVAWFGNRRQTMAQRLSETIAAISPHMPAANADLLARHLAAQLAAHKDMQPLTTRILAADIPPTTPAGRLIQRGAAPSEVIPAVMFGCLATQAAADMRDKPPLPLLALQSELDRLTIFTLYLHKKHPADNKDHVWPQSAAQIGRDVLDDLRNHPPRGSSDDYTRLTLGRNYYHLAAVLRQRLAAPVAAAAEWEQYAAQAREHAVELLEQSLLIERYPEFDENETVYHLHIKGRIRVPFFFGEPGIRLMLCVLYRDMAMALSADHRNEQKPLGEKIVEHWKQAHYMFRKANFGRLDDPRAAQLLIPRMIALARDCPLPQPQATLTAMVSKNTELLYGRYLSAR